MEKEQPIHNSNQSSHFLKTDFVRKLYDLCPQKITTGVAKESSFMQKSMFQWLNLFSERGKTVANRSQMKFPDTIELCNTGTSRSLQRSLEPMI